MGSNAIGLVGILVALGLLIRLAYKGYSMLLVPPAAALVAAAFSGEPLLAKWAQFTRFTHVTAGAQLIFDPGNNPDDDLAAVFSARIRIAF